MPLKMYPGAWAVGVRRSNPNDYITKRRRRVRTFKATARNRRWSKRYFNRGGTLGRNFNRTNRKDSTYFPTVIKTEKTSTSNASTTCYVGHGPAIVQILRTMWWSIIHALFRKSGTTIQNYYLPTDVELQVVLQFQVPTSTTTTTTRAHAINFGATAQYYVIADSFLDYMCQLVSTAVSDVGSFELQNISLRTLDQGTVNAYREIANLQLTDSIFTLAWTSNFKIQNVTEGLIAGDDSKDDITANPLRGKQYWGYGTGPEFKFLTGTVPTATAAIQANTTTGIMDWIRTGWDSIMVQKTERPFNQQTFMGIQKTGNAYMQPGQIRADNLKFWKTYKINTLLKIMFKPMKGYTSTTISDGVIPNVHKVFIGNYKLFGFEKMIATGATNVTVAYELDQSYRGRVREIRHKTDDVHLIL